jgi:hypothetical protein
MNLSDKIPVFALVFGIAYAAIYVICTEVNLPLLTYHPAIGEVGILWQPAKNGPAIIGMGGCLPLRSAHWLSLSLPSPFPKRGSSA